MQFRIFFKILILIILAFPVDGLIAQDVIHPAKENSDCSGALKMEGKVMGPIQLRGGYGNVLEVEGYDFGNPQFIRQEHNSLWIKWQAPVDTELTFDIISHDEGHDLDFMFFRANEADFCQAVQERKKPIRANIARNLPKYNNTTGLKAGAENAFVPSGPGNNFSTPVSVKKGEWYYLLIDNSKQSNTTLTVKFYYEEPKPKPTPDPEPAKTTTKVRVTVKDIKTKAFIPAPIKVKGLDKEPLKLEEDTIHVFESKHHKKLTISAITAGYGKFETEVFIKQQDMVLVDVELSPIQEGDKIVLDEIYFVGDQAVLLPESYPALDELLNIMKLNETLKISIEGHVNGPGKPNTQGFKKLSSDRAKAVKTYLIENGIDKNRMETKGYGNSKMLYPVPRKPEEATLNRRVEIKIISK